MAAILARDKNDKLVYDLLAKVAVMGHYYLNKYAVPKMKSDEQEKYKKFESAALPLVKRFDATTRKLLLPALADAEGGLVLDAKFTTKQIAAGVPEMGQPMPLLEPALIYAVRDAKALVKAGSEYREVVNGLLAVLHESDPDSVPLLAIPEPQVEKSSEGTLYCFPLPEKWGVDKRVKITLGLSKSVLAISANHDHAQRLPSTTLLAVEGVLGDASKPRANAAVLRWAALVDAATPWVEEAVRRQNEQAQSASPVEIPSAAAPETEKTDATEPEKSPKQPGKKKSSHKKNKKKESPPKEANPACEVMPQVHTVLEILKALRTVTFESYADGDALVSHAITEIHDVP